MGETLGYLMQLIDLLDHDLVVVVVVMHLAMAAVVVGDPIFSKFSGACA